jgi:DNA topoisomerase I
MIKQESAMQPGPENLYPHQARVVRRFLQGTRGLVCIHSTGSGKTLTAAALIDALIGRGWVSSAAVIVRKSAVEQFASVIRGVRPGLLSPEDGAPVIVGTHRHVLSKLEGRSRGDFLLVVDEAHEYTNPKSAGLAQLRALLSRYSQPRVLLLTATPIVNANFDLAVLVSLARNQPPPDQDTFERQIVAVWPAGLAAKLASSVDVHLIDKDKDDRFPSLVTRVIRLPMSKATAREYDAQLERPAPFYMNLRQLSLGARSGGCEKCRWLTTRAKEWAAKGEGKIVVYSSFLQQNVPRIREALMRAGLNVLTIDGTTSAADRRRIALMFNRRASEEPRPEMHQDLRRLVSSGSRSSSRGSWGCGKRGIVVTRIAKAKHNTKSRTKSHAYSHTYHQGEGPDGPEPDAADRAYVESLGIPPPWSPAYVCTRNDKLLWVARDLTGKWQYRYSKDWGVQQEYAKVLRLRHMAGSFHADMEDRLQADVAAAKNPSAPAAVRRAGLAAVAVRIISQCHFRVGKKGAATRKGKSRQKVEAAEVNAHEGDAGEGEDATYGVTTLCKRHVQLGKKRVSFTFRGKSGKTNSCDIADAKLAADVAWLMSRTRPSEKRLFAGEITAGHVRQYLHSVRPGLRPKDFRTYIANLMLVKHLAGGPDPTRMKPAQRRRMINEAARLAAQRLNNTPRMTRSSYIFTGMWVLYLVDPTRFKAVVASVGKGGASKPQALLDAFVELFDSNRIDWRYMLDWYKETGGVTPFMGPAQVLLITDAGSESIDLSGTRHIVFLDSTWTPALEDQIVGRGRRFGSHQHLSARDRTVHVWKLHLTRKAHRDAAISPRTSIDAYIDSVNAAKRAQQERIYRRLSALRNTRTAPRAKPTPTRPPAHSRGSRPSA